MKTHWSRREFLKTSAAAVVFGTGEKVFQPALLQFRSAAWACRRNGFCIGFGSGTRFCSIESEDAAQALLGENIQAALGFTPASESDKQRLREKIAPSRSAWENFLLAHEDGTVV
jgi:hypothetical protein